MTKRHTMLTAVIIIIFSLSVVVAGGPNGGGKGKGDGTGPQYFDPATVQTLTGTLTKVQENWEARGNGNFTGTGQHFVFTANGKSYDLILGPVQFLADAGLSLAVGDSATVTGSIVDAYVDGFSDQFIIATTIKANGVTVDIRDEAGYPLWRGGKNGGANGKGVGRGPNGEHYYDPTTVTTLTGKLSQSLLYWNANGNGNNTGGGMHYVFEAGSSSYYLMAGPFWYMEENGIELEEGVSITVEGSVVSPYYDDYQDKDYLIAKKITVDGNALELRDDEGYPLWRSGGNGDYNCPNFDTDSKGTINATVTKVRYRSNGSNVDTGMELKVNANGKKYRVYLGPLYFCENIDTDIAKGDQIRIRGSFDGKNIVAQQVKSENGKNMRFRSNNGNPLWTEGVK